MAVSVSLTISIFRTTVPEKKIQSPAIIDPDSPSPKISSDDPAIPIIPTTELFCRICWISSRSRNLKKKIFVMFRLLFFSNP